jgi:chromatin segregation and condensation protein Rec8/ScpA/Scc1 (kleisin family)
MPWNPDGTRKDPALYKKGAFKMKGFPQHSGISGVQTEKDLAKEMKEGANIADQKTLSENKMLETEVKDAWHPENKGSDIDDLYWRRDYIEETANREGRGTTRQERQDIKSINDRLKDLGVKFD